MSTDSRSECFELFERDSLGDMGIRYYAYLLRPSNVEAARNDPYPFLSEDPLMDAWGSEVDRPRMLYLDKAWRELQHVFAASAERPRPRISLELVKGNVTPVGPYGEHVGYVSVLPPDVVAAVARDIVLFEPVEDAAVLERVPRSNAKYVNEFLCRAQTFTTELAREGLGLVYVIQ